MGGDATHSFTSILLLHALHSLDHSCTYQNNPRPGFGFFWQCRRLFFSSLHTIILHMCASFHSPPHSLSSNIFQHVGGGVGNYSSSSSSSHTPPSACVISYHSSQRSSHCHMFLNMHKTASTQYLVGVRFYWTLTVTSLQKRGLWPHIIGKW